MRIRGRKNYLELTLKGEVAEGRPQRSFLFPRPRTSLRDILDVLARSARDPKIAALVLRLKNPAMGWARLSSIRRSVLGVRKAGKPVLCFLHQGGNPEYYLASACDAVLMQPASSLNLVGLRTEAFFLRDVLDRFGLQPQIQAIGEYKSAGEIFTRTGMSAESREQMGALLDDFWNEYVRALGDRMPDRDRIEFLIDNGPYTAREAAERGLVDIVCYYDEVEKELERRLGAGIRRLPAGKYLRREGKMKRFWSPRRPQIALIDVRGMIVSGESRREPAGRVAGAETIVKFLDHARKSARVRAAVIRVDSPGGSGLASDEIWRGMSLLGESKPVVVSFGDVAASGGYYISAAASCIFAETTTITGSIGVIGGKFVAKDLMQRLSIHQESILRGKHAGYDSPFTPFSPDETERLQSQLEEFYRSDFLKKVAAGRKLSEEAVHQVGRGRVWSGARALQNGLVDRLGGLLEAIEEARRRAGIPEKKKIRLLHYARKRSWREMLIPTLGGSAEAGLLADAAELRLLMEEATRSRILLWMPLHIRIR